MIDAPRPRSANPRPGVSELSVDFAMRKCSLVRPPFGFLHMRYLAALMIGVAACGGAKAPETTANPARGLRPLTMDDPEVTSIAVVAARALPSIGTNSSQPMFSGVYVNGRKARLASDAVARASGFTAISATPRRTSVECTAVSSSGQSKAVQCPPSVKQMIPPVFSFD